METPTAPKTTSFSQQAAKLSWACPLVVFVLLMFTKQVGSQVITEVASLLFIVAGVISGVVALCGMRRNVKRSILAPACVGIIINGLVLFVFVTNFLAARARAQQQQGQLPSASSEASSEQFLVAISKKINATVPKNVDKETRLDTTTAGPGNRLSYFYTLINVRSRDVEPAEFVDAMKPGLIDVYRSNPGMEIFRKKQVELHYHYNDKEGNRVSTIAIAPKDF